MWKLFKLTSFIPRVVTEYTVLYITMTFLWGSSKQPKKGIQTRTGTIVMSEIRRKSTSSSGGPQKSERIIHNNVILQQLNSSKHDSSSSSDHHRNARKHAKRLRSITAEILKEQMSANIASSHKNILGLSNTPNGVVNDKNTTTIDKNKSNNNYNDFAKLEPWVESSSPLSPSTDFHKNKHSCGSDSITEETTICNAFEMLSFKNLCNGTKTMSAEEKDGDDGILYCVSGRDDDVGNQHLTVLGHASDFPREINFERRNIYSRSHGNLREELVINRSRKSKLLKKLLHFKPLSRADRCSTKVLKVKVYVDPPKPILLERDSSIENSTITWPAEFPKAASSIFGFYTETNDQTNKHPNEPHIQYTL
ncbi:MAG: hypothetical protein ACI90V_004182 [Bacillariaceae sp.]